ncbi:tRNA uridine-5-carboxymethylaminomethyl(34) synthesis enzyme MnmG [Alienimonas californiensis]|uniref:tRNA uridine 5-carboxymethylaminomethyl modification enzyme MnmG n=1 Tax=Alienimonas californiensis TaxID=2527989 RepID=A0A517PF14_9PLAN|nr:tRNA uridine-5-carboxymethylaminomethyl(34) synthesis enzyme MnmG [Alienimonas californiensis]QDT17956.1 tRNA uridine 5-carboxymethylaminomethyl modification enzyme MnmG [Alienimonas californiensis]
MPSSAVHRHDVIVIGGGHAGVEAALAAARLGADTLLLSMSCDTVGVMSCNPAIGGVGKGQIVREIDALGGLMGRAIDATGIQFRMLNQSKGPAMHSPRAQADKQDYRRFVKFAVEDAAGVSVRQETVVGLVMSEEEGGRRNEVDGDATPSPSPLPHHRIAGVRVADGTVFHAPAVVLTTGTFMSAVMHTGEAQAKGGRAGEGTTSGLSGALRELGFELSRFKTGTPCRVHGGSVDWAACEPQPGDADPRPFSYLTHRIAQPQVDCYLTETTPAVHDLIRANLHRAPMYSGQIHGTGPRYCPSIEDKVVRFADKSSHQVFLEPEGRDTREVYCNGISTSLPRDVQEELVRGIRGLERARITRLGYAVEYDFAPPTQLKNTLETHRVRGLYFAGQINGTTGYEEAAGQGLLAGANAALAVAGKPPLAIGRDEGYLGVLIDDLVTKGADEPYRMFTSRAEHRLTLRQDNADRRLTPLAAAIGLVGPERTEQLARHEAEIARCEAFLEAHRIEGKTLAERLRRPEVTLESFAELPEWRAERFDPRAAEQAAIGAKYAGYIARQAVEVRKAQRWGAVRIPDGFDFAAVEHLRHEAREKLGSVRPADVGQAGRISGITPADLSVLVVALERAGRDAAAGERSVPLYGAIATDGRTRFFEPARK